MSLATPNFRAAVSKAEARADELGLDLGKLAEQVREGQPQDIASPTEKRERKQFLEGLYATDREADLAFERIIGGNELQDAGFLARGALVARCVARVVIRDASGRLLGYGTGFLVGDGVLITNNHVLGDPGTAAASEIELFYERGLLGEDRTPLRFRLEPQELFHTSKALDFTVVAVTDRSVGGETSLAGFGWVPLISITGKVMEGEWLTIIQHPKGERKQLCVRENQLIKRDTDVLWYSTDTLGGSSGSPVFSNDWLLVALHHMGQPEIKDGKWQTIDGRDYNPSVDTEDKIKWVANEGIRISRIVETLRTDPATATHKRVVPMLDVGVEDIAYRLPVMFRGGTVPALVRELDAISGEATAAAVTAATVPIPPKGEEMSQRLIRLTIAVDDDGSAKIMDSTAAREADLVSSGSRATSKNVVHAPVDPARDWVSGYDPGFLGSGNLSVPLPQVQDKGDIAPLKDAYGQKFSDAEKKAGVLKYNGYSVVMSKSRRFAFFSAANVRWDQRTAIQGREDSWLFDDRIERQYQVDNSYYARNKFDRGHLTRREDMEYGLSGAEATRRANGTCTWTNCTPQHSIFNQDKHPDPAIHLWHGLERYILEETIEADQFSVQLFTGPVFGAADPEYRGIAYPLDFWKVVVALSGSKLFATGYVLGQKSVVDQFGTEAATAEPFGDYELYQRPIRLIEDLTGLKFTYGNNKPLREVDPLEKPAARPRRRTSTHESFGVVDDALRDFADIELG